MPRPRPGRGSNMLFEEEILSHPTYLQYYYYNNEPSNLRLPVPMVSKEAWSAAQGFLQLVISGVIRNRRSTSDVAGAVCKGDKTEFLVNGRKGGRNGLARHQASEWLGCGTLALMGLGFPMPMASGPIARAMLDVL